MIVRLSSRPPFHFQLDDGPLHPMAGVVISSTWDSPKSSVSITLPDRTMIEFKDVTVEALEDP